MTVGNREILPLEPEVGRLAGAYHQMVCGLKGPYWECIYPICREARAAVEDAHQRREEGSR
jgi:hypothetical protein